MVSLFFLLHRLRPHRLHRLWRQYTRQFKPFIPNIIQVQFYTLTPTNFLVDQSSVVRTANNAILRITHSRQVVLTEHSAVSAKTEIYPVNSVIEQQGPGQKIWYYINTNSFTEKFSTSRYLLMVLERKENISITFESLIY